MMSVEDYTGFVLSIPIFGKYRIMSDHFITSKQNIILPPELDTHSPIREVSIQSDKSTQTYTAKLGRIKKNIGPKLQIYLSFDDPKSIEREMIRVISKSNTVVDGYEMMPYIQNLETYFPVLDIIQEKKAKSPDNWSFFNQCFSPSVGYEVHEIQAIKKGMTEDLFSWERAAVLLPVVVFRREKVEDNKTKSSSDSTVLSLQYSNHFICSHAPSYQGLVGWQMAISMFTGYIYCIVDTRVIKRSSDDDSKSISTNSINENTIVAQLRIQSENGQDCWINMVSTSTGFYMYKGNNVNAMFRIQVLRKVFEMRSGAVYVIPPTQRKLASSSTATSPSPAGSSNTTGTNNDNNNPVDNGVFALPSSGNLTNKNSSSRPGTPARGGGAVIGNGTSNSSHSLVRESKFRHIYPEPVKIDHTFQDLRISNLPGEENFISANHLFFATSLSAGGGAFIVEKLTNYTRYPAIHPIFDGHQAPATSFEFHPFHHYTIASASEDCMIKLWNIPTDGLKETQRNSLLTLEGHSKKVTGIKFHPSVNNLLVSVSSDGSTKLWDCESGRNVSTMDQVVDNQYHDLVWNDVGSLYIVSSKDQRLHFIDPRTAKVSTVIENTHSGVKGIKLAAVQDSANRIITVGGGKGGIRQIKIWDPRNHLKIETFCLDLDLSSGSLMPFFDPDTYLLYVGGKGDGSIKIFEVARDCSDIFMVHEYKSNVPNRGMAVIPKRGLTVMNCEIGRVLKLTNSTVEPISFTAPRKSNTVFHADLFPDVYGDVPPHSFQQWVKGSNEMPAFMSLKPSRS